MKTWFPKGLSVSTVIILFFLLLLIPEAQATLLEPKAELLSSDELLWVVKTSPEFRELEASIATTEPSDIWQSGDFTYFLFDLKPVVKSSETLLASYPYAIFATNSEEQVLVGVLIATPDFHTMQVMIEDFNDPEFSQTVALSKGVAKDRCNTEKWAKPFTKPSERRQPQGPCGWYCTETLYHPGHTDTGCRSVCWAGCSFLSDWRAKAVCMAACQGACWVPGWTECVKWEWLCGLP